MMVDLENMVSKFHAVVRLAAASIVAQDNLSYFRRRATGHNSVAGDRAVCSHQWYASVYQAAKQFVRISHTRSRDHVRIEEFLEVALVVFVGLFHGQ